ncbi:hypothetical protein, partial [Pantoea sp. BAV 3049]|uniref:hypothetical protein n=1 Tax=Pantoea sp. BAV 3049 TaxID=2654188 RepID=UPI0018EF0463
ITSTYFRSQKPQYLYRLDYRSPDIILNQGFRGTNNLYWKNNIFGKNTVFTSKSLRGTSRFFLESVLNENVDGSKTVGALSERRYLYPENKKVYVYKINAGSLKHVDVSEDLKDVISHPNSSEIYKFFRKNNPYKGPLNSHEDIMKNNQHYRDLAKLLDYYNKALAYYTEEVIVKGPIMPEWITLYQTL